MTSNTPHSTPSGHGRRSSVRAVPASFTDHRRYASARAALCRRMAKDLMGWHLKSGDSRRLWRDSSGRPIEVVDREGRLRVLCLHPEQLFDNQAFVDLGFQPIDESSLYPFRDLLLSQAAAQGIEVNQEPGRAVATRGPGLVAVATADNAFGFDSTSALRELVTDDYLACRAIELCLMLSADHKEVTP